MSTIEEVDACIKWLGDNVKSNNLVEICKCIDKLSILTVSVGHDVSTAYGLMNDLEDEYKFSFASHVSQSSLSVAKSELEAESKFREKKTFYTQAKNGYKKLSTYLDRIDRVIESYRQLVSVSKLDLKHN
jgi:hypothetical protein